MGDTLCITVIPFTLISTDLSAQFTTHMWVAFIAGVITAFPYVVWELWRFIKPALTVKERTYASGIVFYTSFLFLTGVGPLLAWRKASTNSLKRNFLIPAGVALGVGVLLLVLGIRHVYAWMSLVMATFVGMTIVREFYKGARARASGTGERFHQAIVNLTLRNTRRYGGYIIHFGFVLLFVGWTGQAFTQTDRYPEGKVGDIFRARQYDMRVENIDVRQGPNFTAQFAQVALYEDGSRIANMRPEWRKYGGRDQQGTTEVAIYSTLKEDLYLVFQGAQRSPEGLLLGDFTVYYNPLVMWVWIGGAVLAFGTVVALLPNKQSPGRRKIPAAGSKEGEEVEHAVS